MTGEEILNMTAGREMDALVAKYIMGFGETHIVYRWHDRKQKNFPMKVLFSGPGIGEYDAVVDEDGNKLYCGNPHPFWRIEPYSSSISDAYDAVETVYKMGLQKQYVISLCAVMVHDFGKTSLSKEYHANAHQQTRAALLAVMEAE